MTGIVKRVDLANSFAGRQFKRPIANTLGMILIVLPLVGLA